MEAAQVTEQPMADNLEETRIALVAIAKALGVDIALTPSRASLDELRAKLMPDGDRHYDRLEVARIQLRDIPPVEITDREIETITYYLFFHRRPTGQSLDWPKSTGTKHEVRIENIDSTTPFFTWQFGSLPVERGIELYEYGYDRVGYPYLLTEQRLDASSRHLTENLAVADADHAVDSVPWRGQRFGKEWVFPFKSDLHPSEILNIRFQLYDSGFLKGKFARPSSEAGLRLLDSFARQDHPGAPYFETQKWGEGVSESTEGTDIALQYTFRVFAMWEAPLGTHESPAWLLQREHGTLRRSFHDFSLLEPVTERRFAIALKTTCHLGLPTFTLVHLFDSSRDCSTWADMPRLSAINEWNISGLQPCLFGTGLAVFVYRLYFGCNVWEKRWNSTLDCIDDQLSGKLRDVLSPQRRRQLMFDSADLSASESYFTYLQLLRIAAEWVNESMVHLSQLRNDISKTYPQFLREIAKNVDDQELFAAERANEINWAILLDHQRQLGNGLLARIRRKEEEAKSLRDAVCNSRCETQRVGASLLTYYPEQLFNATSVKEATKSTELNHYVLIFTVVTIFYLPLGYVAALFALGMFSWDNSNQMKSFIISTLAVCLGTYAMSGFLVWFVRKDERRSALKHLGRWLGHRNEGEMK